MEELGFTSGRVHTDRGRLYTVSLHPGKRVYGERLLTVSGTEYREWDPRRSKLSAYITNGGKMFPFTSSSKVLYLGASSGTTPSHVADICPDGKVYCVEFAQRMFRDLVGTCADRPNMMPILGDATKPEKYAVFADSVDIVYQDVAQKRQAEILCDNMDAFGADHGMVAVKARSEDVTASPESVFEISRRVMEDRGFRVTDVRRLDPHEKDHAMIVVERMQ